MADDLDDGEFWLPPQFLTEEDILLGFDTSSSTGFSSDLGSPVTDTESDEDEFVSGELTRPDNKTPNSPKLETPNPPPVSVAKKGTGYFDSSNRGKQSTPVSPLTTHNPNFHLKLQPFHLQQRTTMVGPPASTWPHRKPQSVSSSGMRAVFLGPAKRESVGTGVFLPRSLNPTEPRNKSNTNTNTKNGCATVLVPEKVVQALKNINNNAQPQSQSRLGTAIRVGDSEVTAMVSMVGGTTLTTQRVVVALRCGFHLSGPIDVFLFLGGSPGQ